MLEIHAPEDGSDLLAPDQEVVIIKLQGDESMENMRHKNLCFGGKIFELLVKDDGEVIMTLYHIRF